MGAAGAGLLAAGCTQITVHEADGQVRFEERLGFVQLHTQPGRAPQIIQARGLGVITHEDDVTIGYYDSDLTVLPTDDCRIIAWIDNDTSLEAIKEITALGDTVCLTGPGAPN